MDRIDERIVRALQADAQITNAALAGEVGLSPSACLRRVRELERAGAIRGYRAVLDPAKAGRGFVAYLAVGLNEHTKAASGLFEQALKDVDAIRECHNVAGAFEYLLRVEVADLAAYKALHTDVLGTLPQVASLTTYVVLDTAKDLRG